MSLAGKIVFASGKNGDFDIWSLDLVTEDLKQLTFGDWWNDQPSWSPDGGRIIYVSNRSGAPELWMMREDGSEKQQITGEGRFHSCPVWMPDGRSVICCANYDNPDDVDLWSISVDGAGRREKIAASPGVEASPSVSPDGNKVLVASPRGGKHDIWELEIPSGTWRQITSNSERDCSAAYSPDGRWIAFVSQKAIRDTSDIWIVDVECRKSPIQITHNRGTDNDVSWSPDGKYLIYCASGTVNEARIRIVNLETGLLENFSYDRGPLEQEAGVSVKDFGIFSALTPDFVQKFLLKCFDSPYFGFERHPDWKY